MTNRKYLATVRQINRIKKRIDCDRFQFGDFLDVCPYTLDELRARNRLTDIAVWRHVGSMWLMLCGHSLTSAGAKLERQHCTVVNSLRVVEESLEGFGIAEIKDAILAVCGRAKLPRLQNVPYDEYYALLRKHLGDTDEVEKVAKETHWQIPGIWIS